MADSDVEAVARAWYEATEADNPTATRWDEEWPADTLWLREEYRARARRFLAADPGRKRMEQSIREMIDATAACFRVIAAAGLSDKLQAELAEAGIQDGFGVRAREAIEAALAARTEGT